MRAAAAIAAALLSACATSGDDPPDNLLSRDAREQAMIEETRAFLAAANLEPLPALRWVGPLRIESANRRFAVLKARSKRYLVETERDCASLPYANVNNSSIDIRQRRNLLRPGYDTIRGCRIKAIYELPEAGGETTAPGDGQSEY